MDFAVCREKIINWIIKPGATGQAIFPKRGWGWQDYEAMAGDFGKKKAMEITKSDARIAWRMIFSTKWRPCS
jgi:hypothetical protein